MPQQGGITLKFYNKNTYNDLNLFGTFRNILILGTKGYFKD